MYYKIGIYMTEPRKPQLFSTYQEEPLKVKTLRLPNAMIGHAEALGHGSFTDGVRLALMNTPISIRPSKPPKKARK